MVYEIFRWIHILSYILWLCTYAASLAFGIRIYLAEVPSTIYKLVQTERLVTKWGHMLGAGGIIVSGWVLSTISQGPQWGWFDIQLYPWLALKQLLFVIILLVIAVDLKRSKKMSKWLLSEDPDIKKRVITKWRTAFRLSNTVYLLVLISTLLGWYKPGLTTFGKFF